MRNNSLKLVAAALAIVVAATGVAEAGKYTNLIGAKDVAGSKPNPIEVIAHNDSSPDFDGVFNPKPKPVIGKVIDINKPDLINKVIDIDGPTIHKVLHLFPDSNGAGNGHGGYISYREAARLNIGLKLNCLVGGTPTEFPDDLFIANKGLVEVPAGAHVGWEIASLDLHGVATLQSALKPGKSIGLRGVLKGGVEVGTPCAITAIGQ